MKKYLLALVVASAAAPSNSVLAQQYDFPTVYSPAGCTYTYEITITARIDSVRVTNIYFDDGTTGSFAFEAYVSYQNTVLNSTLPTGNFYTYEISAYSDNPGLSSQVLTNNIGSVPWTTGAAGGFASQNNPTYNASASSLGLSQGQYYSTPSLLAQLGFDSATIFINLPCLDTLLETNGSVPLPLLWSKLEAVADGNAVRLSWTSFAEPDTKEYRVERSTDGGSWMPVTILPGKSREHGAVDGNAYAVSVREPVAGTYYYRVQQVRSDGNGPVSNIVRVTLSRDRSSSPIKIVPNPASAMVSLYGIKSTDELVITDLSGRIMYKGAYRSSLDVSGLAPGMYLLRSGNETGKLIVAENGFE